MRPRTGDSSEAVISWAWISHPAPAPASGTMETPPLARGAQAPNPNQTPLPRTHAPRPGATRGTSIPSRRSWCSSQSHTAQQLPQHHSRGSPAQSQAGHSPEGQGTPGASPCGTAEPWVTHPGTSSPAAITGIACHGDTAWLGQCGAGSSGGHSRALMSPQHPGEARDTSVTHRPRATRSHNTAGPAASQISRIPHPGVHPQEPAGTLRRWHRDTGTAASSGRGGREDDLWDAVPLSRA